ncbi:LysR family transcriptional regulator [Nonomuraea typhae]|uniref:LysR family transcriptional regulator n=1 Tax=Nonomuraea typhae TaxID=2603600 RepID=A0ABW7YWB4_9ACTN
MAEELNVSRAAERLYVSQPALSKQLRALERQLGCTLFDRVHGGVALTRQGEALLPVVRDLVERWSAGLEKVRAAAPAGTLVIGLQTAVGRGLQQRAMRAFRERMPGWEISLRLVSWADASAGLEDGSSDVAFLWLPAPEGLSTLVLATEPRGVMLPEGHSLAALAEIPFPSLYGEPFIALPASAGARRDFWLGMDVRPGAPVVSLTANTAEEAFEGVISGVGVVLVSEGNAMLYKRPGAVYRPVTGLPPSELAIAWRAGDKRPQVTAFVGSLR